MPLLTCRRSLVKRRNLYTLPVEVVFFFFCAIPMSDAFADCRVWSGKTTTLVHNAEFISFYAVLLSDALADRRVCSEKKTQLVHNRQWLLRLSIYRAVPVLDGFLLKSPSSVLYVPLRYETLGTAPAGTQHLAVNHHFSQEDLKQLLMTPRCRGQAVL